MIRQKSSVCYKTSVFSIFFLLYLCSFSGAQDSYRFERMWPVLTHPWYFFTPNNVIVDTDGYVYVADSGNDQICKLTGEGQFVSKWGKRGEGNGEFKTPYGIAADNKGYIYVTDKDNHRIQKFTSDGIYKIQWGIRGSAEKQFEQPNGIAADSTGDIYIVDAGNHRVQKFTGDGVFLKILPVQSGMLDSPRGITVNQDGYIYVTDVLQNRIRKFAADGTDTGWNVSVSLNAPEGIWSDRNGNIYITEMIGHQVRKFAPDGNPVKEWGSRGSRSNEFEGPVGISGDNKGYIYVADTGNHRVQVFSADGFFLSLWGASGRDPGEFKNPHDVAVDSDNCIYVTDMDNNRIQKYHPQEDRWEEWGEEGEFKQPFGVTVFRNPDGSDAVYVADTMNSRIQKFSTDGVFLKMWYGDESPQGKKLKFPRDMAFDSTGKAYVADTYNDRIAVFDSDGVFLNEWVTFGLSDTFDKPQGIAVYEQAGNISVYVADWRNDRVLRFTSDGTFLNQLNPSIPFMAPYGVAVDGAGTVYVSDMEAARIHVFSSEGVPEPVWGEQGTDPGQMDYPRGMDIGPDGKIYVADSDNHRIQVFEKVSDPKTNKAIIVAGGGPYAGNWLWAATQLTANFAYRALTYQGFDKNTIFYLNPDTSVDLDNNGLSDDVDRTATNNNLKYALTEWAGGAENVIVFLTDHGKSGTFRMNGTDILTAAMLDEWLDALQSQISGKIIVIYDACSSGSFLPVLAAPDRIVISSAKENEEAWFISQGSVSFSGFFWTDVFSGKNIADAFEHAVSALNSAVSLQNPQIDGNGNGSGNESPDYDAAGEVKIAGIADYQQDAPVFTAFSAVNSPSDANSAILSASVTDNDGLSRVWAVIQPPGFNSADNSTILEMPAAELLPAGGDRFEGIYEGIASEGNYKILYYARDRHGSVSSAGPVMFSSDNVLKRKAVIVAGNAGEDLQDEVNANADLAFDALVFQGYDKNDDIRSLSSDAALADLGNAVTVWAADNAKDIVIYLIGKGNAGGFQLADTVLSPEILDIWIDTLQQKIPGKVTVICDFAYSDLFLPKLSEENRIAITSGSDVNTLFSAFFWKNVYSGLRAGKAFSQAADAVKTVSGGAAVPLLDDNGNGIANERTDGRLANAYFIGAGIRLTSDQPVANSLPSGAVIVTGTESVTIAADGISSASGISRVWAVITPPGYGTLHQISEPVTIPLSPAGNGCYAVSYNDFQYFGDYRVTVYAEDAQGAVSIVKETVIHRTDGPDIYENDNTVTSAKDIVISDTAQHHSLHTANDADYMRFYGISDMVYTFVISNTGSCGVSSEISDGTVKEISAYENAEWTWKCPGDGIYHVKIAVEEGETWTADASYRIQIYLPVGMFAGFVRGWIADASGVPVANAVIRTSANASAVAGLNGRYMMIQEPGTFDIFIEAEGYETYRGKITVGEGGTTLTDFTLTRIVPPVPDDLIPSVSIASPSADVTLTEGESVLFQANVTGGDAPFSYFWDFGGGAENSHVLNPGNVIFPKAGTYTAVFTVTDADGDLHSASVTVTVKEKEIPGTVPSVSIASPETGISIGEGESVSFAGEVTDGNPPFSYQWNFGNGQISTEQNPGETVFSTAGSYTVTFTVTDADGDIAEDSVMITVAEGEIPVTPDDTEPYAEITSPSGNVTVNTGESLIFSANVSSGNPPFVFHWNFGTAGSSDEKDPGKIAFSTAGEYTVIFTVTDADGDTDSATVKVTVKETAVPVQPVLPETLYPENGKTDISLTQVLTVRTLSDSGFIHSQTKWQISTDENFSFKIKDIETQNHLTEFPVPDLVLKPDTVYYWRVQFRESSGNLSEWSETVSFTTAADDSDADNNGIPDDLQKETDDPAMKCVNTKSGTPGKSICIKGSVNVKSAEFLTAIDTEMLSDIPGEMPFGLVGFRILTDKAGAEAEIIVYLSESIPSGSGWYQYDSISGWNDISDMTATDRTNRIITMKITDGGNGDADGTANGIIVHFSGPVIPALKTISVSGPDSGNAGGCFINSLSF
ncbi:MAG: PKD domain-containing protein [Desulfococcaceae bacterium]